MTMKVTAATFAACSVGRDSMPKDGKPVFAMIGRSNVGKSSMINTLVGRRELAKTSSTPGKTLTLNYYLINESFYLVDLPGYGFAKASKVTRDRVHQMVTDFFEVAESLCGIIHVLDVRHPPSNLDLEMSRWIEEQRFRYLPILTKIDKLGQNDLTKMVRAITKKIGVAAALLFSSKTGQGKDEILDTLEFALANPDAGPLLVRGTGMKPLKKRFPQEQGRGRPEHRQGSGPRQPQKTAPAAGAPQAGAAQDAATVRPEGTPGKPESQPVPGIPTPNQATGAGPNQSGARQGAPSRDGRNQGQRRERRPDQQRQGQGGPRPQNSRPPQAGGPGGAGETGPQAGGQQGPQGQRNRHRPHQRRREGQGGGGNPQSKPGQGGGTPPSNPGSPNQGNPGNSGQNQG